MTLRIHPDLQALPPPLRQEERDQLEANLLADGCLDPLIVWQEEQILLDGHNRLAICERHGLLYQVQEISLPDFDAAQLWVLRHQHGRRNATPNELSYMRGKEYEILKRQGKRTDLTSGNSYQKSPSTATSLAQEHKRSEKTIRNDFAYAKARDTLAQAVGKAVWDTVPDHEHKLTQQDVKALAKMATQHARTAQEALSAVQEAKTPKQVRQIVRQKASEVREYEQYMDAMARSEGLAQWPRPHPPEVQQRAWDRVYVEELGRRLTKALESVDRLHAHLAGDEDWRAGQLPALLEQQSARAIQLARCWGQVEMLLRRSETVLEGIFADVGVPASLRAVPKAPPPAAPAPPARRRGPRPPRTHAP